jgi:PAS domain-containing protein
MGTDGMRKSFSTSFRLFFDALLSVFMRRPRGECRLNHESSSYSDIKDIENLVGTFRQLVSKLSREGNELGELYVNAEKKAARYALLSETVVETVTTGILVVEKGGELGFMNSSARRLLGVSGRDDACTTRLSDLFSDARELESLIKTSLQTGQNSSRNVVAIRTLDGMRKRIGASISCVATDPSAVEAVIVVFTELDAAGRATPVPGPDEKMEIERESYLRGVLDSYDLMSNIMVDAERIETRASQGQMTRDELAALARAVRHTCDLMMVFALSRGASSAVTELADINGIVGSVLKRRKLAACSNVIADLGAGIPNVKTVRKVLEMGLEMLIQGCVEESPRGIEVKTCLWQEAGTEVAGVIIRERDPTKPIIEIGNSLREFAADNRLRREAGLLLLRSLPPETHRIRVEKRGDSFCFSAGILMPIGKKARPSTQSGEISERGQDED